MSQAAEDVVQTSEPDLFGDSRRAGPVTCDLTLRGRLAAKPHIAVRQINGRDLPVLVLELCDVGAGHNNVTAHVPYTNETRPDAEREVRRLKRDQVVEVVCSLVDIRVLMPAASFSLVTA